MNKKLRRIFYTFAFVLFPFYFFLVSCNTTEPPVKEQPLVAVKDTITVNVTQTTHRSITLLINSTYNKPAKSIELYRRRNSLDTLVESYTAFTLEKEIIDDDSGKGLIIDTEYKYFAVRVDSANKWMDTSEIITARTLPPTSHEYTWEEFIIGDEGNSNVLYDVWGTDENNVYAVGGITIDGVRYGVMHWDGNKWEPLKEASGGYAIFGFGENDIWIVGGKVVHFDGEKWEPIDHKIVNNQAVILDPVLFENREYTCIWGTSSENMYLGNAWGKIIRWDGKKAEIEFDTETEIEFQSLKGKGEKIIVGVGANIFGDYFAVRYNGSNWGIIEETRNNRTIESLTIINKQDIIFSGEGLFRLYRSEYYYLLDTDYFVKDIDYNSATGEIFAVGVLGGMHHYNGINWKKLEDISFGRSLFISVLMIDESVICVGITDNSLGKIVIGKKQ